VSIIYDSLKIVAAICLIAYPLTKNISFRRSFLMYPTLKDKIFLSFLFGILSILGNLFGIETFNGAMLNGRIIGPVVGGIIAGPMVGVSAGFIGGIHRYYLGGITIIPAFIANIIAGLIGGFVYKKFGQERTRFTNAFLAGFTSEVILQILILLLTKPRVVAEVIVSMFGVSSIIINALGVGIFVSLVKDIQYSQHSIGANYAEKALEIAKLTLPISKKGFNSKTAKEITEIIYNVTGASAVAITDEKQILAFKGEGSDHHLPGKPILTSATYQAINNEKLFYSDSKVLIANSKEEIGCPNPNCPLDAVIEAPLTYNGELLGFLKVYKINDIINPPDIKMVTGIANLLSLQLQTAKLDEQAKLLARAEYVALRSQINPHFLFNALSVIKLLIRTDPKQAQQLIVNLASFFRRTLKQNEDILPFLEELKIVNFYLTIQKARFGERLQVDMNVDEDCYEVLFPTFALQPLVENSMNHGLTSKKGILKIQISGYIEDNNFIVKVIDNGIGFPDEVIEAVKNNFKNNKMGIGLSNINGRLRSIYGKKYTFELKNISEGSQVLIKIPLT
jgi:LytS/YehU family sensor histidine kinase